MGNGIGKWLAEKVTKEQKLSFTSAFIFTLLVHFYKFVNLLPNHDSVYNYYSDQNILGSGRWALSLACGISTYFDLPWVIGVLSCCYIGLTVAVIVTLFRVHNPVVICLFAGLLAASPATTETFFFQFTADGYFIAMFLAALAVWFSRMGEDRISRQILSGVCICVACGIYQVYVSFALVLALCYFILELFRGFWDKKACLRWVRRQVAVYASALGSYYGIWKLCLFLTGTAVNNYQGISEVGRVSLGLISHGVISSVKSVMLFFLQWDIFEHGLTLYAALNILLLIALAAGLGIACGKSGILRRKWALVLLLLCLLAVVPFSCIWHFVSASVGYRAMMLQCLILLYMLAAVLYEVWAAPVGKQLVLGLLVMIIGNFALMANVSYFYMERCYERTYAEGLEMVMEIHDLQDEHDFERIAVLGSRIYDVQYESVDASGRIMPSGKIHILSGLLEKSLLYDAEHTVLFLRETFGVELERVPNQELKKLMETEQAKEMPCWPAEGSMAVHDGMLILKLSETWAD